MAVPTATTATLPQFTNGLVPATVEPLHQYEKNALMASANPGLLGGGGMVDAQRMLRDYMGNPSAMMGQYTNPLATQYMQQAGTAINSGMAPITAQEVQSIQNPFTDVLKARLSEAGEKTRAAILANQGTRGARSFGDTVQADRMSSLDKEMLMGNREIDYQGFQDALGILENMRNRNMAGGQALGSLGTQAQGITESAAGLGLANIASLFRMGQEQTAQNERNINRQLGAGAYIRDYNQRINDAIGNDMLAEQGNDANKVSQILGWLKSYQSGTDGSSPGANSLQRAAGLAQIGGGIFNQLSGSIFGGGGANTLGGGGDDELFGSI